MTICSRVARFLRSLKIELVEISGTCKKSGMPVSIACSVKQNTMYYLADRIFKPGYQINVLGSTWLWDMAEFAGSQKNGSSVVFLETGRTNKKLRFYGKQYFRIPLWVRGEVSLPLDKKVTKKKDYKEQVRKIRKAGFSFEVTRSLDVFEDFYENMYVPQCSGSHGKSNLIASREKLTENFINFELLIVKDGERTVAGELISYADSIPKLRAVGVRNRDPELLRKGALSACYYLAFMYLEEQGFSRVSVGDTRGFVDDGVLIFKRKWGQTLVEPKPFLLLMRILNDTPATRGVLHALPILCENGGQLESIVFMNAAEIEIAKESSKFVDFHHVPGTGALLACIMGDNMTYSSSSLVRLDA